MTDAVKQVIATDKDGAKLSPEQLAEAGVKPGEQAVVEIRQYTEDGLRAPISRGSRDGGRVSSFAGRALAPSFLTAPRDSGADKRGTGRVPAAVPGAQLAKPRCDRCVSVAAACAGRGPQWTADLTRQRCVPVAAAQAERR